MHWCVLFNRFPGQFRFHVVEDIIEANAFRELATSSKEGDTNEVNDIQSLELPYPFVVFNGTRKNQFFIT